MWCVICCRYDLHSNECPPSCVPEFYLGVPWSKRDEIKRPFSSEAQQRKAYINYFIEHDPDSSWRSVICALDRMNQPDSVEAADNIRHLAEAVPGRAGS